MNFQQIFKFTKVSLSSQTFALCHDRIEKRFRMHYDTGSQLRCTALH